MIPVWYLSKNHNLRLPYIKTVDSSRDSEDRYANKDSICTIKSTCRPQALHSQEVEIYRICPYHSESNFCATLPTFCRRKLPVLLTVPQSEAHLYGTPPDSGLVRSTQARFTGTASVLLAAMCRTARTVHSLFPAVGNPRAPGTLHVPGRIPRGLLPFAFPADGTDGTDCNSVLIIFED